MPKIHRDFIRRAPKKKAKGCGGCDLFNLESGCAVMLRNPVTFKQTIKIAEEYGFGALCNFNPFKVFVYDEFNETGWPVPTALV